MRYRFEFSRRAETYLRKMDRKGQERIAEMVRLLAEDPFREGTKKLKGYPLRTARVGDWRIVYEVFPREMLFQVDHIGPRGQVYRRLR